MVDLSYGGYQVVILVWVWLVLVGRAVQTVGWLVVGGAALDERERGRRYIHRVAQTWRRWEKKSCVQAMEQTSKMQVRLAQSTTAAHVHRLLLLPPPRPEGMRVRGMYHRSSLTVMSVRDGITEKHTQLEFCQNR